MNITISSEHNDARLNGTLNFLNTGSGVAKLLIFGGTQPVFGGSAAGPALVEIDLQNPAGIISSGVLSLLQVENGLIAVTGTATWGRVLNRAGNIAFDCDVSDEVGDGFIKLTQTNLFAGGRCGITSSALT